MRKLRNSTIAKARPRWWECGDYKTGEAYTIGLARPNLIPEFCKVAFRSFFILFFLYASSCAQPQLIEDSTLNQQRIHDTVRRASYASGLPVSRPLSVKLINRHDLHEILQERTVALKQSDVWAARQAGYRAMGFLPEEGPEVYEEVGHLSRSAAGLYLPRKQTLYVVGEPARSEKGGIYLNSFGDLGNEVNLAHEVVHALQHQRYPELFDSDEAVWHQQADAAIALQAAREGDANLRSAQSLGFLGSARDPDEVLELSRDTKFAPLSDAPTLIRERILFPYLYGYRFAFHEGKNGLQSPPASTEQVIHIKNKGRSAFLAFDLSDFTKALDSMGCRVLFQDTMGELTLSLWFRSFNFSTDQRVWDGWDGDRWIAADCEHSQEVIWLTSWDTEQDAQEFERAVTVIAANWQRIAKLGSPLVVEQHGREVLVTSGGLRPEIGQLKQLAKRARVTTRAELAAHFSRAKVPIDLSTLRK